jgi:D-arabinose 5-phosphate isomerase GutQ
MLNFDKYKSFLPDILFTVKNYSHEIEELVKEIKKCKEENRKLVVLGYGRSGKVGERLSRGLRACSVRAYKYPEEVTKMPNLGGVRGVGSENGDLVLTLSGTGTTEQTLENYDTVIYYNKKAGKKPIVYGFTHELTSPLAKRVKRCDGTLIYVKGQKSDAVSDFFKRQMETPPPITPMGSRPEYNALKLFDGLVLLAYLYLDKNEFDLEPFEKRFYRSCECFASLEESLKKEKQQEELVNMIRDLSAAKRFITIASGYSSKVTDMVCDRARNVYPEDVDVMNFDSTMEPIDIHIIPGTKVLSVTKTGHSGFTIRNVNRAAELGASYSLITENQRTELARCNRKVIAPSSASCTANIGNRYKLRMDETELVIGDCVVITVNAVLGRTEEHMIANHPDGYEATDRARQSKPTSNA